jgi:hypothetical protein
MIQLNKKTKTNQETSYKSHKKLKCEIQNIINNHKMIKNDKKKQNG